MLTNGQLIMEEQVLWTYRRAAAETKRTKGALRDLVTSEALNEYYVPALDQVFLNKAELDAL